MVKIRRYQDITVVDQHHCDFVLFEKCAPADSMRTIMRTKSDGVAKSSWATAEPRSRMYDRDAGGRWLEGTVGRWGVGALGRLDGEGDLKQENILLRQPELSRFGAKIRKYKEPFPRRP